MSDDRVEAFPTGLFLAEPVWRIVNHATQAVRRNARLRRSGPGSGTWRRFPIGREVVKEIRG